MTRAQTLSLAIAAVLAALAVGWMAGRGSHGEAPTSTGTANVRKLLYYRAPMGSDTSPVPKKDPMGMDYVPVYAGDEAPRALGTVVMSPDKVQALGVRTEAVRRESLAGRVRASGTVQVDETRQFVIAPRFEGWVERLYANQTGMHVRAGQPLVAVYSPQLAAAQQEFRLADAAARTLAQSDPVSGASMARLRDAARERLRNWDIGEAQIAHLGRDRAPRNLVLTSPAGAVVVEKPIVEGARFAPGDTILRLADLSTVWVIASVPVAQASGIAVGQPARFESVALRGQTFDGKVTFIQPVVDAQTRTVDVRVAFANRAGDLRPGLFGTVLLEQPNSQPTLTVPRSAVLDSGTRQLVLVQTAPGRFAPRDVTLGQRAGDRVEVLRGLARGEPVVVSANFLIDAESNLQSALEAFSGHAGHGAPAGNNGSVPASGTDAAQEAHVGHETPATPDPHAGHEATPAAPDAPRPAAPKPATPPPAQPADPHAGHGLAPAEPAEPVMLAPGGQDTNRHEDY